MSTKQIDTSKTDDSEETIVARSTPPGSSVRAIVRMSGPETTSILLQLVAEKQETWVREHSFSARRMDLHLETSYQVDIPSDVLLMKAPRSYTCEDTAELHVPGSVPLIEMLIEQIQTFGARLARPGEFTERAFLNGRLDLTQAEAVLSLIEARTEEERDMALGQLEGRLSRKVRDLRERLTHLCAYVESALDFADQDIDIIDRDGIRSYLEPIRARVSEIIETGKEQQPLREDPRCAFYGRPNVGKSSLFNTLIEEDRSIVTEVAGTTRDVIEGTLVDEGRSIRLFDTAGVENEGTETEDQLERKMMEKTERAVQRAGMILHLEEARSVLDRKEFPPEEEEEQETNRIYVLSKADQLTESERDRLEERISKMKSHPVVLTSTVTERGIDQLKRMMFDRFDEQGTSGGAFRMNMRHVKHLEEAKEHLDRGIQAVNQGRPYELIAVDLREGLDSLGKIVGEVDVEDILGVIFSEFCIGK